MSGLAVRRSEREHCLGFGQEQGIALATGNKPDPTVALALIGFKAQRQSPIKFLDSASRGTFGRRRRLLWDPNQAPSIVLLSKTARRCSEQPPAGRSSRTAGSVLARRPRLGASAPPRCLAPREGKPPVRCRVTRCPRFVWVSWSKLRLRP